MDLSPLSKVIPSWDSPTLQGFDLNNVQEGERIKGSNRQYVRFYNKKFNEVYTVEAKINEITGTSTPIKVGTREIVKEMVNIVTPGDKNEVDDVACDFHKREHWAQYKAFREGRSAPLGLPLDDCNFISPNVATELRYLGCHTVEQLADSSDILCNQIPDGFQLREFARAHCKTEVDNKSLNKVNLLTAKLEESNAVIAKMQEQIQGLLNARGQPINQELETFGTPPVVAKKRVRRTKAQIAADNAALKE